MGDPRKLRKQYATPMHPWSAEALAEERILTKEYGLKNKKEIYRANTFLKKYRSIAKRLATSNGAQAEKETAQVLGKLVRLGILPAGSGLSDILSLQSRDILERRLQTRVFRLGLARSTTQARQFITHRHVMVNGVEISSPSYLVDVKEDSTVTFRGKSSLSNIEHPERSIVTKEEVVEEVVEEPQDDATKFEKEMEKVQEEQDE